MCSSVAVMRSSSTLTGGSFCDIAMIKNYIFDLVGVIGDFGTKRIFQHFIELGATDVWELNNEMDLGYLSGEKFLIEVQKRCLGTTVEQLRAEYIAPMTLPAQHLKMLCDLRKEHRVFLLSNVGDMHWQHFVETVEERGFRLDDCFDAVFPSFQTHYNKPDARAFQHLVAATGINPSETLFLDDSSANVQAAIDLGLQGEVIIPSFPNPQYGKLLAIK